MRQAGLICLLISAHDTHAPQSRDSGVLASTRVLPESSHRGLDSLLSRNSVPAAQGVQQLGSTGGGRASREVGAGLSLTAGAELRAREACPPPAHRKHVSPRIGQGPRRTVRSKSWGSDGRKSLRSLHVP